MWSTPSDDLTPMLAQYHALKQQYSDCLLFFRLGDFYELFYEDAQIGSKELGLVLTSRPAGKGKERIPMCGVPYHSASSYISRLVSKGYKVALCEQLEDASQAKGIVRRDVIRVITPGTYFEKEVCGVAAVYVKNKKHHCAYLNPSTGEFVAGSFSAEDAQEFLLKFSPKELLVLPNYPTEKLQKILKVFINPINEEDVEEGYRLLKEDMGVYHPTALGFEEEGPLYACGVLYRYLKITQKGFMPLVGRPKPYSDEGYVRIDYRTRRGLELIESYEGREDLSLLGVIDRTLTSMGRRLLRFYLLHPFGKREKILKVQEAVEELLKDRELLKDVREVLEGMPDLERLVSRISGNVATPRDLVLLKKAAEKVSKLKALLMERAKSQLLRELAEKMEDLEDLRRDIDNTLVEDPPLHVKEGGLIKEGVNPTLDELRSIKEKGAQILREYEDRLRRETGINSLKIGFNKVMGYYIEVTKPNLRFVPSYFKRRQTLSSGERFTTQELETLEEKLLSADVRIKELEYQLFLQLRERVLEKLPAVSSTASPVAHVDYLQSLAYVALQKGWVKPQMVEEPVLHIEEGRHPVVEAYVKDFVPNDTHMDESSFVYIITGPNMAGKSSYIRQVALLTLLAHMGSFLPCRSARIGIVSSIHARVGSGDVLALGISTFMNEMLEVAGILSSADRRSLIVLDEVGRGTSTHDGIAISKAIVEYIVRKIGARTLVATHYTELTELEDKLPHVVNYHMAVSRDGSQIKFLYRLRRGKAEASLGIYVAKMAGLPQEVVNRAQELLSEPILEKVYEKSQEEETKRLTEEILRLIEGIDIATTTPLDALITLARLKEMVKNIRYTHK